MGLHICFAKEDRRQAENGIQQVLGKRYIILLLISSSLVFFFFRCTNSALPGWQDSCTTNPNDVNKPRRPISHEKQRKAYRAPLNYQQTANVPHFWGALFIQWQLQSTPGNTEDIPVPNNVAEELCSKLPSQIGSVASTQLGLKYGNCISH